MIKQYFTTCRDGNIAYHVNDVEKAVDKNRFNLGTKYNICTDSLKFMEQTHGCNIQVVNHNSKDCIKDCDALITSDSNLPLMVMVADCIPILIYDEKQKVIAAVHAGRNGTFLEIAKKTISLMIEKFNCQTQDIKVTLGPSIQHCCYEVSLELIEIVKTSFGEEFVNGRLIDLQKINKKQLLDIGIKNENINISSICTKCSGQDYYSYRLDKKCGRFAGIIVIE